MRRIPTLDGWRGIAIALVLFDHFQYAWLHRYAKAWTQTGQHGVTIFFVLSGFLITTKLLESPIDLKRFFIRRIFRLMPVAWTFLVAMLLFDYSMHTHFLSWTELLGCLLFYRNFLGVAGGGAAGHFWSLSIEEQFYMVWPVLLLFGGIRRCRWIAFTGAAACALYRWAFWAHYDHNLVDYQTQVRADALLIGCLLAMLLTGSRMRAIFVRWSGLMTPIALAVLAYSINGFHWLIPLRESVAIAVLIAASVMYPRSILERLLSFAPLAWLGTISYSVYVWQAFFMLPWTDAIRPWLLAIGLPAISLASFYGIEKPLARFGHRLTDLRPAIYPAPQRSQEPITTRA